MMIQKCCTAVIPRHPDGGTAKTGWKQKRPSRLIASALAAMAGCLLLGACASSPVDMPVSDQSISSSHTQSTPMMPADEAIIADIIGFTEQLLNPFSTTLQFRKNGDDPLLEYFIGELADTGYGIQRVSADQGSNFVGYTRSESKNDSGDTIVKFDTSIGAIRIGRDYTLRKANIISPASPVRLSGTRSALNVADKPTQTFETSENPDNASVRYVASLNLDQQAPPVISLLTDDLVNRVVDQNTQAISAQALNSSRIEVNNLFFSNESNFTNVLDGYQQVDRQIIVFGNDSLILGSTNKLLLENLVEQRLEPDDLIGLIGCSNGATDLDIGNEGLALGRAKRVTEALLSQGIARERILDEGCWAPVTAGDKFPTRGVVLELWRRTS